jgi:hypothetical protein
MQCGLKVREAWGYTMADPDELTAAEQAKSLLAGLNIDTSIRLRWALRDVKAKRTKLFPLNADDLAALMDLGFVEMRDEVPVLTNAGHQVLD